MSGIITIKEWAMNITSEKLILNKTEDYMQLTKHEKNT